MRRLLWRQLSVLLLLAGVAELWLHVGSAGADELPPASVERTPTVTKPDLATVTIEAQRQKKIKQEISTYLASITMPTRDEALLRWHSPVCPAVVGLQRDQAEYVLVRISQAARDSQAPLGPEDCAPDLLVIFSTDANALLNKWWSRNKRLFNQDRGIGGIKRFLASDQPIRVWYNGNLDCLGGAFRVRGGGTYTPSHCTGGLGTHLSWNTIRVIVSAIVVVDPAKVADVTLQQVADYVAMVGLAQIRESATPGVAPTILHLFDRDVGSKPASLSPYDQAFLKSLYATNASDVVQKSEIETQMYEAVTH